MLVSTKKIHANLSRLGQALGFTVTKEVDDSLLRVRLDEGYRPRIDLMWSLALTDTQREALAIVLDRKLDDVRHLPIVGIEIEGSQPSTKIMAADVANLAALGAPLGLLVVSEEGEANIYRRAARAIRTVRRSFGDLRIVPAEASWFEALSEQGWPGGLSSILKPRNATPAGGENLEWSKETRDKIRRIGTAAEFVVVEPFTPSALDLTYELAHHRGEMKHTIDPVHGIRRPISKAGEYLTECMIDMAWLMPLPAGLRAFLEELDRLDPSLREHGLLFSEQWGHCAVAAFELESSTGKHAGGGLLNLAAYGVIGIVLTRTGAATLAMQRALRTYQPTLGLRNVFIREMS
jgi:hypothetical protein